MNIINEKDSCCTCCCVEAKSVGKFGGFINKNLYITKVTVNKPAIIVFWSDNTKTIAKCSKEDVWDAEKGLSICVLKKVYGSEWVQKLFSDWVINENDTLTLNEVRRLHRWLEKNESK